MKRFNLIVGASLVMVAVAAPALGQTPSSDAESHGSVTILLIGDSTVADYPKGSPLQGWGQALRELVDDRVTIVNAARNGRSSKSFRAEGLWDAARKTKADYVFIQFGHNDNPGKGPERSTDPGPGGDFRKNLRQYVDDVRAMGATPILVTPVSRRNFGPDGRIDPADANTPYAEATLAVAAEAKCSVVDLNRLSRELFDKLGDAGSAAFQTPADRTHFSPAGALQMATLVVADVQEREPKLKRHVLEDKLQRP